MCWNLTAFLKLRFITRPILNQMNSVYIRTIYSGPLKSISALAFNLCLGIAWGLIPSSFVPENWRAFVISLTHTAPLDRNTILYFTLMKFRKEGKLGNSLYITFHLPLISSPFHSCVVHVTLYSVNIKLAYQVPHPQKKSTNSIWVLFILISHLQKTKGEAKNFDWMLAGIFQI